MVCRSFAAFFLLFCPLLDIYFKITSTYIISYLSISQHFKPSQKRDSFFYLPIAILNYKKFLYNLDIKYNLNYMNNYNWYSQIIKPTWSPPGWLFGPVWSFLYILIFISFGKVALMFFNKQISFLILLPFILNLIFNLAFTPIQFGLQNNLLATLDVILVLGTLIWAIIVIYPYAHWIAYMQIPYLLWVSFATVLQTTITYLNR